MRFPLGVPIRVRDTVFGNLYLTEKRGADEFDAEDEAVLSTLAVAAGVAIENARLYEEARLRERWLRASSEVTNTLMPGAPSADVLGLIVEQARVIAAADVGMIAEYVAGAAALQPTCAVGVDAEQRSGLVLSAQDDFVGAALSAAEPVVSADIANDVRIGAGEQPWTGLGPVVAVPLGSGGKSHGVLLLGRLAGRAGFVDADTGPLLGFAGQAALALELAERRRDAEQIALLRDRDRIARYLHDLAIQRLFAAGMTLQSTQRFVDHPEAVARLSRTVDDLDDTIKIIRSTIFGLRSQAAGATGARGLRERVSSAVQASVNVLGFAPALRIEGLVETEVDHEVADHALAVVGEALSNAARHSGARSVSVHLRCEGGELEVTVTDDGRGLPRGDARSGLRNLEERALSLGGTLTLGERLLPVSRLVSPSPISVRISRSRGVRRASSGGADGESAGSARRVRMSRAVVSGSSMDWPEATVRTAETRSATLICLSTYPLAPAMIASNRASSSSKDVSMSTARPGIRLRSSRQTLMPSPSGRRTSSTATCGRRAGPRTSAFSTFSASPTTEMSGSASSRSDRPRRTTS